MIKTGLVSITFRPKNPLEICRLVADSGLDGIEWGGDVHVPTGDMKTAALVRRMTIDHGLEVASYGSYYRAGGQSDEDFPIVLDTAIALGAPNVRVWAGNTGSAVTDSDSRKSIVESLVNCGELALSAGITLSMEFHGGTLTDDPFSLGKLMSELGTSNVHFYWQPRWDWEEEKRLGSLLLIKSRLTNLHVFTWSHPDGKVLRHPLEVGESHLCEALALAAQDGQKRWALIEFVEGDTSESFVKDAACLKTLVAKVTE